MQTKGFVLGCLKEGHSDQCIILKLTIFRKMKKNSRCFLKEHETIVDKVLCFLCMGEKLILEMSLTFDTIVGDEYYILFAQSRAR